jgi:hypothetical protein
MNDRIDWVICSTVSLLRWGRRARDELRVAEEHLGHTFPSGLLASRNGLFDPSGQWHFVWPLDRIVSDNLTLGVDPASGLPNGSFWPP